MAGLDEKKVRAAFEQTFGLNVKGFAKLLEDDPAGDRDRFGGGTDGAGYEARLGGRGELIGGLACELGGAAAQQGRVGGKAVFGEDDGCAAETIGFDDIGGGIEIF